MGIKGYTVISETDGFWSSSVCEKIATSTIDWSKTTLTNKKLYDIKTSNYVERKVDWNGLLYDWNVSEIIDGRGSRYYLPIEMFRTKDQGSYIDDNYRGNNTIESLSVPPKLCFPASERRDTPQIKTGVKSGQNVGYERWTVLECTQAPGDPESERVLKNFQDKDGDQRDYGAWKKLSSTPPARIRIALEGPIFENLKKNYGSTAVTKMFDDPIGNGLLQCLTEKYGATSSEVKEINGSVDGKIAKRKTQRLQIISDILLAEKMIENVKTLEDLSSNLGAGGLFDYTFFLEQLNETSKVVGISDAQLSEANAEKIGLETDNGFVDMQLKMCKGGSNYSGTEADYKFTYDYYYPKGYTDGKVAYSPAQGTLEDLLTSLDSLNKRVLGPSGNPIKTGFENGKREGYRDGYIAGFEQAKRDAEYEDYLRNQGR
ncbi:MAG: hypothetical protein Athens071416_244 [Parcubacteria group bacterium Athens0714_16]|nr:MAG: hypothetical protein Athens071416_244 [Parcubacteria group bacterium Athens0714_16]